MAWKITVTDGGGPKSLSDDVIVPGGFRMGHELKVSNAGGINKYLPAERIDPIVLTLVQPLGHDKALFDLFEKKAGFKVKLTLSLPTESERATEDIKDINLSEMVPEEIQVTDDAISLTIRTLTKPEVKWVKAPPPR